MAITRQALSRPIQSADGKPARQDQLQYIEGPEHIWQGLAQQARCRWKQPAVETTGEGEWELIGDDTNNDDEAGCCLSRVSTGQPDVVSASVLAVHGAALSTTGGWHDAG